MNRRTRWQLRLIMAEFALLALLFMMFGGPVARIERRLARLQGQLDQILADYTAEDQQP